MTPGWWGGALRKGEVNATYIPGRSRVRKQKRGNFFSFKEANYHLILLFSGGGEQVYKRGKVAL